MKVLGIETSCDETAVGIVEDGYKLLSNTVVSQIDIHAAYGGVVPEVAARSHIEAIIPTIDESLNTAFPALAKSTVEEKMADIDAIAVTYGAGLGGSLLIGVTTARSLSIALKKPLYAINHVEAHVYANFLTEVAPSLQGLTLQDYALPKEQPKFPLLALIVSGKHSQLALFKDHFDYRLLGESQDDAIGEAFDKVAKMTGLPYPGGPSVAEKAKQGNPTAFQLPKAKLANPYDSSFSGLKTAVLRHAQAACGHDFTFPSKDLPGALSDTQKADIAAVFQRVAIETVVDKTIRAFEEHSPASVVIAGGVASSQELRRQLSERLQISIDYTDPRLCTDNGAMVATLGCFTAMHGRPTADPYTLEINPSLKM